MESSTFWVLLIVVLVGAVGGAVGHLVRMKGFKTSFKPQLLHMEVVGKNNNVQGVGSSDYLLDQTVTSTVGLAANIVIGIASGFLLYAFDGGTEGALIIGGDGLTLSVWQTGLVLLGGIGSASLIESLISERAWKQAAKSTQAAASGAGLENVSVHFTQGPT